MAEPLASLCTRSLHAHCVVCQHHRPPCGVHAKRSACSTARHRHTLWGVCFLSVCSPCSDLACCTLTHTQVRAAAALANIKQVDEEELEVIVGSTIEKPTVIDFYATWCGPCLLLAQELEKVSSSPSMSSCLWCSCCALVQCVVQSSAAWCSLVQLLRSYWLDSRTCPDV